MDFQTSDGVRLNYRIQGQGQPVVLIHGFGGYQQFGVSRYPSCWQTVTRWLAMTSATMARQDTLLAWLRWTG